jgi:glycosyltransferase involved in cell wall biosynthesis
MHNELLLSIVMPVYNEAATVETIVERVLAVPLPKELIVVDDGSTDGTGELLRRLSDESAGNELRVLSQPWNRGKGAALRRGIKEARGQYVVIQDGDLEYDPRDYPALLRPCLEQQADVVYGSRFVGGAERRVLLFWHSVGNWILTLISNAFTDLNLTDMETGYKLFRREVIQAIELKQDRFGFEPEVTAKIAHRGLRIFEVGISYNGRGYEDGKKIGWRDAVQALFCIINYGIESRLTAGRKLTVLRAGRASASGGADHLSHGRRQRDVAQSVPRRQFGL